MEIKYFYIFSCTWHGVKVKITNMCIVVHRYLGRKRLNITDEYFVEGSTTLVWPSYSYWTLSYMISSRGAKKLMDQRPLTKLVPVDEYLPIMFDKHPRYVLLIKCFYPEFKIFIKLILACISVCLSFNK